jgi:gliding motility-associated-like protein
MKKTLLAAGIFFALLTNHAFSQAVNTLDNLGLTASTPSEAAYSLNKLSSAYTGAAIQVRRSSDNITQNISFGAGGKLDTVALLAFVGSDNGFVTVWYDQSGHTRDLTQTDFNRQPAIVHDGTIYRRNGLPTLYHDPYDDGLIYTGADYMASIPLTVNTVAGSNSYNGGARRAIQGSSNWLIGPYGNNDGWHADGWNVYYSENPWSLTRVENFTVIEPDVDPVIAWRDGALQPMYGNVKGVPYKLNTATCGAYFEPLDGYISELLGFNIALSNTERLALEQSQKVMYGIVSSNPLLSALSGSAGTLNPTFSSTNTTYTAIVDYAVTNFNVTPTGASADATMEVQVNSGGYTPVTNGAISGDLPLNVGANTVEIKITAPDGSTTKTYTITVNRAPLPPTVQASNLTTTNTRALATTLNWTNGNGDKRAVFVTEALTGSPVPEAGITYLADSIFKAGTQIGSTGWYCVYKGTGTSVTMLGLKANSTYRTMVVEFNGDNGTERYFTTSATGNPANVTTTGLNTLDKLGLNNTVNSTGAIYALRLLSSDYAGPLARINIGGSYYDVYPDASTDKTFSLSSPISGAYSNYNDVKTGATINTLSTIVSAATNASVAIWYDQSANDIDAIQDNTGNQPAIINAGDIYRENGKPALKFDASAAQYFRSLKNITISDGATANTVAQNINNISTYAAIISQQQGGNGQIGFHLGQLNSNFGFGIYNGGFQQSLFSYQNPKAPIIATGTYGNSLINLYVNKTQQSSGNASSYLTSTSIFYVGANWYGGEYFDGYIPEVTLFTAGISTTERQAIEASQYNYFGLGLPYVITNPVGNIKFAGVTFSGKLISDFDNGPTTRGFVYGTAADPTLSNNVLTDSGSGLGDFTKVATGLSESTLYHFRAYATNSAGTAYGADQTFTTLQAPNVLDKLGVTNSSLAEAAYSMRVLSSTYTGPLARIRIVNDYYDVYADATADKAFSLTSPISAAYSSWDAAQTGVTASALSTIVSGSTEARVVTWYDQSGYANDAVQTDQNRQPDIITGGAIHNENGRAALLFSANRATFLLSKKNATIVNASSANAVAQNISTPAGGYQAIICQLHSGGNISFMLNHIGTTIGYTLYNGTFPQATFNSDFPVVPFVATGTYGGNTINFYLNGTTGTPANTSADISTDNPLYIGANWGSGDSFDGYIPEATVFASELPKATRESIEDSQITYYNITGASVLSAGDSLAATTAFIGNPSVSTSFTVSGLRLTAPLVVTPSDAAFEVSTDSLTFASSVSIGTTGNIAPTKVFVRLAATNALGTYQSNIVISSTGAQSITVAMPASKVTPALNYLDRAGLVETAPADAAYAMRLLSNTYTGPLARISVNGNYYDVFPDASTDKNFSFNSTISAVYNTWDATQTGATTDKLSSVISATTDARVVTWYDQSGYDNNAIQTDQNRQPEIITAGIINNENGRPALKFSFSRSTFLLSTKNVTIVDGSSANAVAQNISTPPSGFNAIICQLYSGGNISFMLNHQSTSMGYTVYNGNFPQATTNSDFPIMPFVATGTYGGSTINFYLNGITGTPANTSPNISSDNPLYIGASWSGAESFDGYIAEATVFSSLIATANRQSIETNQIAHYNIGGTGVLSSSGTLAATNAFVGSPSANNTLTVSGTDLIAPLVVTPPSGFEVSTDDVTFAPSVSIGTTGSVAATAVYIRLAATDSIGTYQGNVTISSIGTPSAYAAIPASTVSPAPNFLDKAGLAATAPATGAYAMRLLSSTYAGPLTRININGVYYDVFPDATADKAFSLTSPISAAYTNYNDTKTGSTANLLSSIIGANSATIAIWYDQGGQNNDAVQESTGNQPQIINSGVINKLHDRPAPSYYGNQWLNIPQTFYRPDHPNAVVNIVYQNTEHSGDQSVWGADNGGWDRLQLLHWGGSANPAYGLSNGGGTTSTPATETFDQIVYSAVMNYGTTDGTFVAVNGVENTPFTESQGDGTGNIAIGAVGGYGGFPMIGNISEFTLFFNAVPTGNRHDLETNQTNYYRVSYPTVATNSASAITTTTATLTGETLADAGHAITVKGIVYGKTANPTIGVDDVVNDGDGVGAISVNVTNLDVGTGYHYRAYATNSEGTSYGDDKSFLTKSLPSVLDKLGLSAGTIGAGTYSLRLLSSDYHGPLARINIGGSYYDVYPDATTGKAFSLTSPISATVVSYNEIPAAATTNLLSSVIGSNSATVAIWYDQSGKQNNGVQQDANMQPELINAGTINVDDSNSLPAIKFNGGTNLIVTSTDFNDDLSGSLVYNATIDNASSDDPSRWFTMNGIFGSEQGGDTQDFGYGILNGRFTAGFGGSDDGISTATAVNTAVARITSWTRNSASGDVNLYNNAVADGAKTLSAGNRSSVPSISIGSIQTFGGGGVFYNGTISEMTLFPIVYSDTEKHAVEQSQATYYNISINTAPTDIALSATAVDENVAAESTVGTFTTTDTEGGSMTYELVSGTGDDDNAAFTLSADTLKINASPDYETKNSYSILLRVTDAGSLSFDKHLTISINDLAEVVVNETSFASTTVGVSYSEPVTAAGGTAPYTFAITAGSLPTGLSIAANAGDAVISGQPTTAGTFNFTITATDANDFTGSTAYSIVVAAGTPAITYAATASKTYGDADFDPAASSTNTSGTITYSSGDDNIATIVNNKVHIVKPGIVTVYADQLADDNYNAAAQQSQTLTISRKDLTLALNATPAITRSYTGLTGATLATGNYRLVGVSGTDEVTVSGTANYDNGNVGSGKPITAGSFVLAGDHKDNYTLSTTSATTTGNITRAVLIVTANSKTKTYGQGLVAAPGSTGFTSSALQNSETIGSVTITYTTGGATTSAAGNYTAAIKPSLATGGTFTASNYNITYVAADLLVEKASQTITYAALPSATYGAANFAPGATSTNSSIPITYTSSNLAVATIVANKIHLVGPGSTDITAHQAGDNNRLVASDAVQSLTVNKAPLVITASNQAKVYGAALPALTLSYSGFVNGETKADLTTQPTPATTATAASPVNTYPITASGAVSDKYSLSYVAGTLTVAKAPLTITADDKIKNYGAALPTLTITYKGFANGDNSTSLTTQPTVTTSATAASVVSNYPITISGAVSSNYSISYVPGTLTVNKAALTITVGDKTKNYGAALPTLTAAYTGFVNGDNSTSLTTQPTLTTTATAASAVNTYPITARGAVSNNYSVSYVAGRLTVNKVPLTITANNVAKLYGAANPSLTANYNGFVNGDTDASLTRQPTLTTAAGTATSPGSYGIAISGASSPNYILTYVNGNLTIIPLSTDKLANITISSGALSPAFAAGTSNYTVIVGYDVERVTITASFDPTASVTLNGTPIPNGSESFTIAVPVGTTTATVVVTAQDGITKTTYTLTLSKASPPVTIVPTNILSPNGDGTNDGWIIKDIELYPDNDVIIYNKVGREVYRKRGYDNSWKGTLNGAPLPQGTYYYVIHLGPGIAPIKGFITLLRSR